jgi:hypothetical protein
MNLGSSANGLNVFPYRAAHGRKSFSGRSITRRVPQGAEGHSLLKHKNSKQIGRTDFLEVAGWRALTNSGS